MEERTVNEYLNDYVQNEFLRMKSLLEKCKSSNWSVESLVYLASCVESYIFYHDELDGLEKVKK